jgi:hypothetical protein
MKTIARYLTHILCSCFVTLLVFGIALGSISAFAQSGAGSIQGTVTDATGAVIPGASIHVVNQATSVAADTKSNDVGFYQVPDLFTGSYSVTVTAPGMKTYKTAIELLVAQSAVIHPTMTAGAVSEQVEVNANMVQLTTTDNGTLTATLENDRINQLPMNGRMLLTLAGEVTPGLVSTGERANGLMPEALEYVADGVPEINRNFGGAGNNASYQAQLPDPDSIQEVQIETTNTSAMYSEPSTAIITTKSGTNGLHGSLFETARNNAIGIAKNRNNPANYAAPHLVRNEFGGSAGGPIILPHVYHGKDKSFWFFAYERYSLAQITNELVSVPTQAMKSGDFSGLVNSSGVLQQLYDPATTAPSTNCNGTGVANQYCRAPFLNNQIPISRLSPFAKVIDDITPAPTTADNPLVAANLNTTDPIYQVIPTITFRLDHNFNENNKAYLRYTSNTQFDETLNNNPINFPASIAADGLPAGINGVSVLPFWNYGGAVGYTHVFSPTFFAETVASMLWQKQFVGAIDPGVDWESKLGLPNNFGEQGLPQLGYYGSSPYSTLISLYQGNQSGYQMDSNISTLDENFTKTLGRHQMQFGARYRHERYMYFIGYASDNIGYGNYASALENPASGTNYTQAPNTGFGQADFFLGAAATYTLSLSPPRVHYHDMEFDGYFQDNYHVSRNLTLNLGLRYEAHPAPWAKYGLIEGFDLKNDAVVLPNPLSSYISAGYTTQTIATNLANDGVTFETAQQAGQPSALVENRDFTFGPRIGLAYTPFGGKLGTVVRGAYGRYIYPAPVRNTIMNSIGNVPFQASYAQSYTAANQSPDGLPNYLLRAPQSVVTGVNSSNVVNSSTVNAIIPAINQWAMNPDYAPDYVTQTNFTIEQPFKGNTALRVSWVWSHGTNLDQYYYYNNHPSTYVWEIVNGIVPPTGGASTLGTNQYAATATGPYDQRVWGSNTLSQKTGWSNDNLLEINYQKLFRHGTAFQASYVWSKPFRVGGNYFRDGTIDTAQNYANSGLATMTPLPGASGVVAPALPPARPAGIAPYADWHALNVFEEYKIDNGIGIDQLKVNGIVDLPFGRGQRFLGNSNRFMDELAGGWQIAGDGGYNTSMYAPSSSNWGPTNPITQYKHKAAITDCRSGVCHPSYEWFNGYIAPTANANVDCTAKCVSGLPSNWVPYEIPINNTPGTSNYGNNNVNLTAPTLNGGAPALVAYSPGPMGNNLYSKTFLRSPINTTIDLSVFKVFPITERTSLRFNVDAFNALNQQGYNAPSGSDGTEAVASQVAASANTPRQVQFTLRLTF